MTKIVQVVVDEITKEKIEKASKYLGLSASSFLRNAGIEKYNEIILKTELEATQ